MENFAIRLSAIHVQQVSPYHRAFTVENTNPYQAKVSQDSRYPFVRRSAEGRFYCIVLNMPPVAFNHFVLHAAITWQLTGGSC